MSISFRLSERGVYGGDLLFAFRRAGETWRQVDDGNVLQSHG
jgi:hypothetical protein